MDQYLRTADAVVKGRAPSEVAELEVQEPDRGSFLTEETDPFVSGEIDVDIPTHGSWKHGRSILRGRAQVIGSKNVSKSGTAAYS